MQEIFSFWTRDHAYFRRESTVIKLWYFRNTRVTALPLAAPMLVNSRTNMLIAVLGDSPYGLKNMDSGRQLMARYCA